MTFKEEKKISDPLFWNLLYEQNKDKWNLKIPTPTFVEWEKKNLKNKNINICFPGCGKGSDALYFASRGYNVYAIDFQGIKWTFNIDSQLIGTPAIANINNDDF